jgi:hypothetical protein
MPRPRSRARNTQRRRPCSPSVHSSATTMGSLTLAIIRRCSARIVNQANTLVKARRPSIRSAPHRTGRNRPTPATIARAALWIRNEAEIHVDGRRTVPYISIWRAERLVAAVEVTAWASNTKADRDTARLSRGCAANAGAGGGLSSLGIPSAAGRASETGSALRAFWIRTN